MATLFAFAISGFCRKTNPFLAPLPLGEEARNERVRAERSEEIMRQTPSLRSALTRQLHRCAVALPPSPRGRGFYFAIIVALTTFARAELSYPPKLADRKTVVTDTSDAFIKRNEAIAKDVDVARTAPTIDFMYCPKQTYVGNPWSVWGDGLAIKGKYYSAIGDHTGPRGNAFVFEYDPARKTMRTIVDVQSVLNLPEGHYTPGKIHSRIDMGRDGHLYFSTHRGSTRVTTDEYHYKGDWILQHDLAKGKTNIIAQGPVPKHCIPTGLLDPDRLIFYGGTASGALGEKNVMFFAYDIAKRKVLHTAPNGPYRYLIFAKSSGRVYYVNEDNGPLMRYDPKSGKLPKQIDGSIGLRSATLETPDGYVYTVSTRRDGTIWRFNTKTEKIEKIGNVAVGARTYVTSIDADPTGRYLYYTPGAHGGAEQDGTPIVQFDTKTRRKKIIAFLFPFYRDKYGYTPIGTFASAIDSKGEKLYVTWNGNREGPDKRGRYRFDTCAMTVIHIPESER